MTNKWLKYLSGCLALVILTITFTSCPGTDDSDDGNTVIPEVTIKRVAPNNLDLPGVDVTDIVTTEDGGLIINNAVRVWVPQGAVANPTQVIVRAFTAVPSSLTSTKKDAVAVKLISDFYDLGPDNVSFELPVQVTIAYSHEQLPDGADEKQIGPVIFDGRNWVPVARHIDTEKNLVSFQTKSFPGMSAALTVLGYNVGWAGAIAIGAVTAVAVVFGGYQVYQYVNADPEYWEKAPRYITPGDATVKKYADMARLERKNAGGKITLDSLLTDPETLAEYASHESYIHFMDGKTRLGLEYVATNDLNDWQMPAAYFNDGMKGDCKNVANAMASVFRSKGINAICTSGFSKGEDHTWMEFEIDQKLYYLGAHGEVMPLDQAIKEHGITRPVDTSKGRGNMWTEKGQSPYKENWWVKQLEISIDVEKAFPGGLVKIYVTDPAKVDIYIDLTINRPDGGVFHKNGRADLFGVYQLDLPLAEDTPAGTYQVTARNTETDVSGEAFYIVFIPQITVLTEDKAYQPGEELALNILFSPARVTTLEIEGAREEFETNEAGLAWPTLTIPAGAAPGQYQLVVRAPEYNASGYAIYTVAGDETDTKPETRISGFYNAAQVVSRIGLTDLDNNGIRGNTQNSYLSSWVACRMSGNHVYGTGSQSNYRTKGVFTLDVWFNQDLSTASGSYSFTGEDGTKISFEFSNVPRATNEKIIGNYSWNHQGPVWYVEGISVLDYISNFSDTCPGRWYKITGTRPYEEAYIAISIADLDEVQLKSIQ